MPFLVRLLPRAERDLEAIYNYIGANSSDAAHRWFNGLEAAIASLAHIPERNPRTAEDPQLRHHLYGNKPHIYRIIYRLGERTNRVVVQHIRHRARDKNA